MILENFVLDVDGVLTDGTFYYSEKGKIMKKFGPHDSDGLKLIADLIKIEFISADKRGFRISERRVNDMGFDLTLVQEQDRENYIKKNYSIENLVFMGDGYFDTNIVEMAALGIAPNNALDQVKKVANFVTKNNGGNGAVFEACNYLKNIIDDQKQK